MNQSEKFRYMIHSRIKYELSECFRADGLVETVKSGYDDFDFDLHKIASRFQDDPRDAREWADLTDKAEIIGRECFDEVNKQLKSALEQINNIFM